MVSTEKILPPGMMPGKDEIELYIQKYKDPEYTLLDVINSFDSSTLDQKGKEAFQRRYPSSTGVGYKDDRPLQPVYERYELMATLHTEYMRDLKVEESYFRKKESPNAYKALRAAFSKAIGIKVCLDCLKAELAETPKEVQEKQAKVYDLYRKEQEEKWDRKERIYDLMDSDPDFLRNRGSYDLDNEDHAIINQMVRDWRTARDNEPSVQVQKLTMLRKQLKLNQRAFAKKIGYPVSKYPQLEQGKISEYRLDRRELLMNPEDLDWFMHLLKETKANPHWLLDENELSLDSVNEKATLGDGNDNGWMDPMFATEEEIQKWYQDAPTTAGRTSTAPCAPSR